MQRTPLIYLIGYIIVVLWLREVLIYIIWFTRKYLYSPLIAPFYLIIGRNIGYEKIL